jgi:nicotinate-nucleotide adenylyltransferase
MVEIGIAGNPRFELSLLEAGADVSYTFESVLDFRRRGLAREQIHLLVGGDSLEEMIQWRHPEKIFRNATIIVMHRPGHGGIPTLPDGAAVIALECGSNTISSSGIRQRVHDGRSIRYLVPEPVERFIEEHALYRSR